VHRLKTAYRQYFPKALPELEEYLSNPVIYRAKNRRCCGRSAISPVAGHILYNFNPTSFF